jgi:hypothetical protein
MKQRWLQDCHPKRMEFLTQRRKDAKAKDHPENL